MNLIPMLDLRAEYEYMKADIDAALAGCIGHQKWILGPEVRELEERISAYLGVKHCIGVSSGTEALLLSLRAMAILRKGEEYFSSTDEVITTPFTFTATGDAILRSGATPVFVDIDQSTYNIDPAKVRKYIESRSARKVVGIVPVHLYGQACDMDEISALAKEHGLFIVEDVAQAFGGRWKGKKLGSIGTTGCFSFFPSKNLGGFGDGGMVSTGDDETAEMVRILLKHGGKDKYNVDHIGYNARLDTIQAAVLLAKLNYVNEFNERRREIAERYYAGLKGLGGLSLPETLSGTYHAYHQYTVRSSARDDLQKYLKEKGIGSMIYYPTPLHKMKLFGEGRAKISSQMTHTEKARAEVLSLPVEPLQDNGITEYIIKSIREFFV